MLRPLGNVLYLNPPFVISEVDMEENGVDLSRLLRSMLYRSRAKITGMENNPARCLTS